MEPVSDVVLMVHEARVPLYRAHPLVAAWILALQAAFAARSLSYSRWPAGLDRGAWSGDLDCRGIGGRRDVVIYRWARPCVQAGYHPCNSENLSDIAPAKGLLTPPASGIVSGMYPACGRLEKDVRRRVRSYRDIRGHEPDFFVRYRLYSPEEGGRKVTFQHLRCDFSYGGDDPATDGIYAIHPEFLDAAGQPLPDEEPVPLSGRASMWVLFPRMRQEVHCGRIKVGTCGSFMEGARRVGEVEVDEVGGLHENPV